jgi:osmoprotectant transport system substrate-binding protein
MRVRHLTAKSLLATTLLVSALTLTACGTPGSGGGEEEPTANASATGRPCLPVPGDKLVVLEDDKGLQNADNIIPAINKEAAEKNPEIVDLLSSVSAALDTQKLILLNKSVDIDRKTSSEVAKAFVETQGLAATDKSGSGKLLVGAANFSENVTLAEIYGEVLRSAGFDVTVRSIGARETYLPALSSGKGGLVAIPEYAATLADFLNADVNGKDAKSVASDDVDATVTALAPLAEEKNLVVGKASAAQDQNAFAVTAGFAAEHKVTSLSELAAACGGGLSLAGPAECPDRPFCQPGLEETYGLTFTKFTSYDFGLIGAAVRKGEAAIGLVLSSDGSLAS